MPDRDPRPMRPLGDVPPGADPGLKKRIETFLAEEEARKALAAKREAAERARWQAQPLWKRILTNPMTMPQTAEGWQQAGMEADASMNPINALPDKWADKFPNLLRTGPAGFMWNLGARMAQKAIESMPEEDRPMFAQDPKRHAQRRFDEGKIAHIERKAKEQEFQRWYSMVAKQQGLDPDPDNPLHYYDYRAAHAAGAEPGPDGHWPSEFKRPGHPNLIVEGRDTRDGTIVTPEEQRALKAPARHRAFGGPNDRVGRWNAEQAKADSTRAARQIEARRGKPNYGVPKGRGK